MRKDGWWSYDADGRTEAALLTTPLLLGAPSAVGAKATLALFVNVLTSVRGSLRCEVLDAATMQPLPGLTLNDSVPLMGNYVRQQMQWLPRGVEGLAASSGRSVRLRFVAFAAKLFTFELGVI
jgi:hypothetical protein